METDNKEELLDIVDEHDNVIGQKTRGELYAEGKKNFRVVNIFLKNSEGKLWIPRRCASKKLFPLCLDMSAAGHVGAGETYEEAAYKEIEEELNVAPNSITLKDFGYFPPHESDGSSHMHTYEFISDEAPNYNREDFCEYYWLTPEEVVERIERGDQAKSDLPKLVKKYYLK